MIRRTAPLAVVVLAVALAATAPGLTAPPQLIRYQARLTDDAGVPLTGNHDISFAVYDADSGGSVLWSEGPRSVTLSNGVLDILMGEVTPIPSSVFASSDRWLEVTADGTTLAPRQRLSSVPYTHASDRLGDKTLAEVLDRASHTGTQPPASISPQGPASGLNADRLDGLHSFEIVDQAAGQAARDACPLYRFVGVTTGTVAANAGFKGLGDQCHTEGGASYRVCTSEEIMKTPVGLWLSLSGSAWVHPEFVDFDVGFALDFSGNLNDFASLTCDTWSITTGVGLSLSDTGVLEESLCSTPRRVACCRPWVGQDVACAPYGFVGVTTATSAGDQGWKALNELCDGEFGTTYPEIRMCFSREIQRAPTKDWPTVSTAAWVHPSPVGMVQAASLNVLDVSGIDGVASDISCRGWGSVGGAGGLALDPVRFTTASCSVARPVTCCAPLP